MWTLDEALMTVREQIEPALAGHGWHCAIAGGVMLHGSSKHDLDLVVFPHNSSSSVVENMREALRAVGMIQTQEISDMHHKWSTRGITDRKLVEIWLNAGRRIDIIISPPVTP